MQQHTVSLQPDNSTVKRMSSFSPPSDWRQPGGQYHTGPWLDVPKDTGLHTRAHFLFPLLQLEKEGAFTEGRLNT